ncbi:MAG: hypothetical protein ACREDH_08510, partial [Methylocella sp.]
MEPRSSDDRMKARIQLVEEHIRLENLHNLDGILPHSARMPGMTTNHGATTALAVIRFTSTI